MSNGSSSNEEPANKKQKTLLFNSRTIENVEALNFIDNEFYHPLSGK
jgi:hypothetical protein